MFMAAFDDFISVAAAYGVGMVGFYLVNAVLDALGKLKLGNEQFVVIFDAADGLV